MWIALTLGSVALAAIVGWALPAWAAGRLVRAFEATGRSVANFRGTNVSLGLGLVWVVWAVGIAAAWNLIGFASQLLMAGMSATEVPPDWLVSFGYSPFAIVVAAVPFLLVVGAALFGLADDAFGGGADKGFRGHLSALREGRLTTGMLKLLGIGALSFVAATGISGSVAGADPMSSSAVGWAQAGYTLFAWIAATLVIALAANLLNLTDLRPGRALKAYVPLALAGAGLSVWSFWRAMEQRIIESAAAEAVNGAAAATPGLPTGGPLWVWFAGVAACLLVLVLGPVFAVWRYDLGERAMLGDAGANAMGALAGFLLARSAPLWLLGALALVLLALNLISESVSFSSVIEKTPVLRWIDGLGRLASEPAAEGTEVSIGSDDGTRAGGPAAADEKPRRDDVS